MKLRSTVLAVSLAAALLLGGPPSALASVPDPPVPAAPVFPSSPVKLADVVTSPPAGSARLGDALVFSGGAGTGYEPWVTDGTPSGTHLLRDINPGATGSTPAYFVAFRGLVYFSATSPEHGYELWATDGTTAGTRLVADIWPGTDSSLPQFLTVEGGALYFQARTPAWGAELWVSDGTSAGTRLHSDIRPGEGGSRPYALTRLKDRLLIAASPADDLVKLYVAEAVGAAAVRLDASPEATDLRVESPTPLGDNSAVFTARTPARGQEIWVTRGLAGDARVLMDINPGPQSSYPSSLTRVGDRAVFTAHTEALGEEPWVTDGTQAGTALLRDLVPGDGASDVDGFVSTGDLAFFVEKSRFPHLWVTRGTPETTESVPVPAGTESLGDITGSVAGWVTMPAYSAGSMSVLATDGTPSGTRFLPGLVAGPTGNAHGIGTLGGTQIIAIGSGLDPDSLYAWTAVATTTTALPKRGYKAQQAKRKKITVKVLVAASAGTSPSGGVVTLTKKGRVVGRARLVDGTANVRVRIRLKPGKRHRLVATWSGSIEGATSMSSRFVIKVRPPR